MRLSYRQVFLQTIFPTVRCAEEREVPGSVVNQAAQSAIPQKGQITRHLHRNWRRQWAMPEVHEQNNRGAEPNGCRLPAEEKQESRQAILSETQDSHMLTEIPVRVWENCDAVASTLSALVGIVVPGQSVCRLESGWDRLLCSLVVRASLDCRVSQLRKVETVFAVSGLQILGITSKSETYELLIHEMQETHPFESMSLNTYSSSTSLTGQEERLKAPKNLKGLISAINLNLFQVTSYRFWEVVYSFKRMYYIITCRDIIYHYNSLYIYIYLHSIQFGYCKSRHFCKGWLEAMNQCSSQIAIDDLRQNLKLLVVNEAHQGGHIVGGFILPLDFSIIHSVLPFSIGSISWRWWPYTEICVD